MLFMENLQPFDVICTESRVSIIHVLNFEQKSPYQLGLNTGGGWHLFGPEVHVNMKVKPTLFCAKKVRLRDDPKRPGATLNFFWQMT